MRTVKIALAVLLLAAGAAAAFPWYLGVRTEQAFQTGHDNDGLEHVRLGRNSPLSVTLVRYERGWLRSNAVHRVALRADPEVSFEVHHTIRHLPDPQQGLIVVESTPRWPDTVQSAADYYFGGQHALSLRSVVRFDRGVSVSMHSPAFSRPLLTEPGVTLSWGGASGELSMRGPARVALALDMPRIEVDGPGVNAVFAGIDLTGDWIVAGNQAEWSGETTLALDELSLRSPFGGGTLKGFQTNVVQRDQGDTVMVGYLLQVREGTTTELGAQPEGFKDAVLDLEIDRLDKKTLAKYFDDIAGAQQAQVSAQAQSRLAMQLATDMMQGMLKASPELRLKKLGMQTAAGRLAGSAVLSFDGAGIAEAASPADLIARVKFSGSAEMSSTLLQSWMVKGAQAQAASKLACEAVPDEEAQVEVLAQQLVQKQLAGLEASGLLKADGDKFTVRAEFDGGRFSVNGMPADQFLPGPMPPARPAGVESKV